MIWVGGRVVADEDLKISVLDRTLEHGLGLFETLRTWNAHAPLLDRHLDRLKRSARELGIPLNPDSLPDQDAVTELVEREHLGNDVTLRITLTGGFDASHGSTLFMKARPLPAPLKHNGACIELGSWKLGSTDDLAHYKTLNYWARRRAYETAQQLGLDETVAVLGSSNLTLVLEGSRTNFFWVCENTLYTPPLSLPIVPGIMRALVIELAGQLGLEIVEGGFLKLLLPLTVETEIFLTNSVRGIIPVRKILLSDFTGLTEWPTPGPVTQRLMILVSDWLQSQGPSR